MIAQVEEIKNNRKVPVAVMATKTLDTRLSISSLSICAEIQRATMLRLAECSNIPNSPTMLKIFESWKR